MKETYTVVRRKAENKKYIFYFTSTGFLEVTFFITPPTTFIRNEEK